MHLSCIVIKIWRLKHDGVTILTFCRTVTWPITSRDRPTRGGPLIISGPLWPCVYLASLWRYGASKLDTGGRTLRWFYTLSNAMHCIGQTTRSVKARWKPSTHVFKRFLSIIPSKKLMLRPNISGLQPVIINKSWIVIPYWIRMTKPYVLL